MTDNFETEMKNFKQLIKNGDVKKAILSVVLSKAHLASLDGISSGNICGDMKAFNNNGKLDYAPDRVVTVYDTKCAEEARETLKTFYHKASLLLHSPQVKLDDRQKLELLNNLTEVRDWCLDNGFYGKGLDISKLINKKYRVCCADALEKAVRGYAERQLLRGVDCYQKANIAIKDALLGKYGTIAKLRGRSYYVNAFKTTRINLPVKKKFGKVGFVTFGMEDYAKATKIVGPVQ